MFVAAFTKTRRRPTLHEAALRASSLDTCREDHYGHHGHLMKSNSSGRCNNELYLSKDEARKRMLSWKKTTSLRYKPKQK